MLKAICAMSLALAATASAQTFTALVNFHQGDGAVPAAALIQGLDGSLYGTTEFGGDVVDCPQGCGTVFKLNAEPNVASLQLLPEDGTYSLATLTMTANGNFYGTTSGGGAYGAGTIFEVIDRQEHLLYSFCAQANCTDGKWPQTALTQAADGNFYGTTPFGGKNTDGCGALSVGCGTVFKISTNGTLTTLYNFCARSKCVDGMSPQGGLIQADDGDLYGTTFAGGTHALGTIFRITPSGKLTTIYSFCALAQCSDGSQPVGALLQATDGNFYGTTFAFAGTLGGTVFKVTKAGVLT
jgi:uncharacterized repeat protein (TIGR03803 family)